MSDRPTETTAAQVTARMPEAYRAALTTFHDLTKYASALAPAELKTKRAALGIAKFLGGDRLIMAIAKALVAQLHPDVDAEVVGHVYTQKGSGSPSVSALVQTLRADGPHGTEVEQELQALRAECASRPRVDGGRPALPGDDAFVTWFDDAVAAAIDDASPKPRAPLERMRPAGAQQETPESISPASKKVASAVHKALSSHRAAFRQELRQDRQEAMQGLHRGLFDDMEKESAKITGHVTAEGAKRDEHVTAERIKLDEEAFERHKDLVQGQIELAEQQAALAQQQAAEAAEAAKARIEARKEALERSKAEREAKLEREAVALAAKKAEDAAKSAEAAAKGAESRAYAASGATMAMEGLMVARLDGIKQDTADIKAVTASKTSS